MCDNYRAPELHHVVSGRVRVIERARSGGEATIQRPGAARLGFSILTPGLLHRAALCSARLGAQTNLVIEHRRTGSGDEGGRKALKP